MAKEEKFKIRPGIYTVPHIGRVDCRKSLPQAKALELYLNKHFSSFISLTEAGAKFLKKQKLTASQIAQLIVRSTSKEEVELLLTVNDTDTVKRIAEKKLKTFE